MAASVQVRVRSQELLGTFAQPLPKTKSERTTSRDAVAPLEREGLETERDMAILCLAELEAGGDPQLKSATKGNQACFYVAELVGARRFIGIKGNEK